LSFSPRENTDLQSYVGAFELFIFTMGSEEKTRQAAIYSAFVPLFPSFFLEQSLKGLPLDRACVSAFGLFSSTTK